MLRVKRNQILPVLILPVISLLFSCGGSLKNVGTLESGRDTLGPGDVIEIRFSDFSEFDQTLVVPPGGKLRLRAVGEIQVADLTEEVLQKVVNDKYNGVLGTRGISVRVFQSSSFQIYVGGELKRPGVVKFKGDLSIAQGILLAGGLKDSATDYEVMVFRKKVQSGMKIHKFRLKKDGRPDKAMIDFILAPYDVLFVVKSLLGAKQGRKLI